MSLENVEIMRRAWQAFIIGGVDATLDFWTEDCVFEEFPEMPESAVYVGRDRLPEAVEHFTEVWSDIVFEPLEFIDAGEQLVITVVAYRGRGGAGGAPLDALAPGSTRCGTEGFSGREPLRRRSRPSKPILSTTATRNCTVRR